MKIIEFSFDADVIKTYHKVKKDKKVESGDFIIEGYIMTSDIDSQDTIITDDAIKKSKNDLLKYSTVLFNHDMNRPIGKILETDFDKKGLWVKMKLSKFETEIKEKVKEGIISKFSIKGRVMKDSIEKVDRNNKPKKEQKDSEMSPSDKFVRKITRLELYEASLVSVPANVKARTINWYIVKALELDDMKKPNKKEKIIKKSSKNKEKKEIVKKASKKKEISKKSSEKKGMIGKLKNLIDKLKSNKDKNTVNYAINALEKANKYHYKHTENVLGLSDKSENIYEINNNTDTIELDGNKFRKQILKIGKWYHWDADGGILNIDKDSISNIVKNFKENTIEHVYIPLTHTNDPIKNAGEVVDLITTDDGLDAICEIKDKNVFKKIKDGLIKCVSASIDENYMKKDNGKYVGPTLLHTALVAEPYLKGMSGFTELSEEFKNKNIISLSDTEPTINDLMELFKKNLLSKFKKEIVKLKKEIGEKKSKKNIKNNKIMKKNKKVKSLEEKPKKVLKIKSKFNSKVAISKKRVDLAEAKKVYRKYLKQGKVVPAQKDTLISLLTSKSEIKLGDDQVDIKKVLSSFLKNQPKIVDYEEKGTQKVKKVERVERNNVPTDAIKFYSKMGLNKKQTREAWEFAQESAKSEEEDKSTLF